MQVLTDSMFEAIASALLVLFLDSQTKRIVGSPFWGSRWSRGARLRIYRVGRVKAIYRSGAIRTLLILLWIAALASALLLHHFGGRFQSNMALWGLGAAFGGAMGNLRDIIQHHYVIDFIHFGWWPAFNLADVAILAGLALAFLC